MDLEKEAIETEVLVEKKSVHTCNKCQFESFFPFALRAHHKRNHSKKKEHSICTVDDLQEYTCKYCGFTSKLRVNYWLHLKNHLLIISRINYKYRLPATHYYRYFRKLAEPIELFIRTYYYYLGDHNYSNNYEANFRTLKCCVKIFVCHKCDYSTSSKTIMERHVCTKHTLDQLRTWIRSYDNVRENLKICRISKPTSINSRKESTTNVNPITQMLSCKLCNYCTLNKTKMIYHKRFCKNPVSMYFCRNGNCKFATANNKYLQKHIREIHNPKQKAARNTLYECPDADCSFVTWDKRTLTAHKTRFHWKHENGLLALQKVRMHQRKQQENVPAPASLNFQTSNQETMETLGRQVDTEKACDYYKCTDCDYKTKELVELRAHQSRNHYKYLDKYNVEKVDSFSTCRDCKFGGNCARTLKRHIQLEHTSSDEEQRINCFRCPICQFKVKEKQHLNQHISNKHGKVEIERMD